MPMVQLRTDETPSPPSGRASPALLGNAPTPSLTEVCGVPSKRGVMPCSECIATRVGTLMRTDSAQCNTAQNLRPNFLCTPPVPDAGQRLSAEPGSTLEIAADVTRLARVMEVIDHQNPQPIACLARAPIRGWEVAIELGGSKALQARERLLAHGRSIAFQVLPTDL
jgi:hypothetical protein